MPNGLHNSATAHITICNCPIVVICIIICMVAQIYKGLSQLYLTNVMYNLQNKTS